MPFHEIKIDKDWLKRIEKALEEYQLSMFDFKVAINHLDKLIPDVERKEDRYGNDYFECPDCGKKYTYRSFDGFCEKCGKRMIW